MGFAVGGESCFSYRSPVKISGTQIAHPGVRGWWAVKPDHPICMIKDPSDICATAHQGVEELQLILNGQEDFDRYRPLLGEKVSVSGTLSPHLNAHHHETRVLVTVGGIDPRSETSRRTAPTSPSHSALLDVEWYFCFRDRYVSSR